MSVRSFDFPTYSGPTNGSAGLQCDAVEVTVRYTYQSRVPLITLLAPTIPVSGSQRFVNEPFGPCS